MHIFIKSKHGNEHIIPVNHLRLYGDEKTTEYRIFDGEGSISNYTSISKKEYNRIKAILKQLNREELKKMAEEIEDEQIREQWKGQINALLGLEV